MQLIAKEPRIDPAVPFSQNLRFPLSSASSTAAAVSVSVIHTSISPPCSAPRIPLIFDLPRAITTRYLIFCRSSHGIVMHFRFQSQSSHLPSLSKNIAHMLPTAPLAASSNRCWSVI